MCRHVSVIVVLSLFPVAVLGQHTGRHTAGTGGGTTAAAEDPDVTTFEHAVAVQATEAQVIQFRRMVQSTEAARQQAHDLRHLGTDESDSVVLTHKATGLQVSVDEAQSENRAFRRSFLDSQEAGLKNLTRKLTKADSAVSKAANVISQQVDQGTLNRESLANAAASLERALAAFKSDQLSLGKDMGIQPH